MEENKNPRAKSLGPVVKLANGTVPEWKLRRAVIAAQHDPNISGGVPLAD